jgi:hypothetical protein
VLPEHFKAAENVSAIVLAAGYWRLLRLPAPLGPRYEALLHLMPKNNTSVPRHRGH